MDYAGIILSIIEVESIKHYAGIIELLRSITVKFSQQNSVHIDVPKFMDTVLLF